jgi:hypothetical protein
MRFIFRFQAYPQSLENEAPLPAIVLNLELISGQPKDQTQKPPGFRTRFFFKHQVSCPKCENSRVKICFSQNYFHKKVRIKSWSLEFSQERHGAKWLLFSVSCSANSPLFV